MDNKTKEANKELAKKVSEMGASLNNLASRIEKGEMADYDVICVLGGNVTLLNRYLKKYQEATPYGQKLIAEGK